MPNTKSVKFPNNTNNTQPIGKSRTFNTNTSTNSISEIKNKNFHHVNPNNKERTAVSAYANNKKNNSSFLSKLSSKLPSMPNPFSRRSNIPNPMLKTNQTRVGGKLNKTQKNININNNIINNKM